MLKRTRSTRVLEWWAHLVGRHSLLVVLLSFAATAGILAYTVTHFRIDTDLTNMISDKLPYRKLEQEFQRAFPQLGDTIVVVIDAESPGAARYQGNRMAQRLRETGLFKRVYMPGGGEFFEKNGLLYLSVNELEELADKLAASQPLLGLLSRDFTLRGLFSVAEKMVSQREDVEQNESLVPFFDGLSKALDSAASDRPYRLSWQDLVMGKPSALEMRQQFIILEPVSENGEEGIEAVHRVTGDLGLQGGGSVRVRVTGDIALAYENLLAMRSGMGITTLASFVLVALALMVGFGSGRLVFATLMTLLVGFIWTFGFAIVFVGHLNLVSVTFGVLFIGLGIDYGIQFCLRYRELIASGLEHPEACVRTAKGVGVGLRLCTVAAAIGFYSFLPTAYTGVSELGLIAGTGMFINLFATLTVLPALLTLMPPKKSALKGFIAAGTLYQVPYKYAKAIRTGAILAGIGAALFVPRLFFDYNPLNLYDPHSEAVSTATDLFKDEKTSPWTISVLAGNAKEAEETAGRLKGLKEVKEAITLADFVPDNQSAKMDILSNIVLFMPPGLETLNPEKLSLDSKKESLKRFGAVLKNSILPSGGEKNDYLTSLRRLSGALDRFQGVLDQPKTAEGAFDRLEKGLLSEIPLLFHDLASSLQARAFTELDLPRELRAQYVTPDGRCRVEVFPRENILNIDALERFVDAVTAVAPNAIDTPVTIRGAGKAVVDSFLQATLYAVLAITAYLLIELRRVSDTVLVLLPLLLSLLLTGAASVLLHIPFNFANVIVVPLLLGAGVEGIYFIYRFRTEPPPSGNMLETSTARALFFSTLTTILSFSPLSFSPHRGIASMGKLLTLCIGFLMITTLLLLPSLLNMMRSRKDASGSSPSVH